MATATVTRRFFGDWPLPAPRVWAALHSPEAATTALILFTALCRTLAAYFVGLGYGESYHFSCARHPSLSYFDHPPMGVMLGALGMWLWGDVSPLALRLPFVLMFAGTTWLVFLLGRRFFGAWPAFYAALLLNLSAVFSLSVGVFLQSDGPLVFFCLCCVACLAQIFFEPVRRAYLWWCLVGLTLGLAMLSKYHAVFIAFGAGMFALTHRQSRRWVWHPGPYLALGIAAVVFGPVLLWNQQHGWISFLWQSSRGLDNHGLRFDWLFRNIGGQALWLLPWIWAPLLWELPVSFRQGPKSKERWFLAWLAVAPIVLFTVVSLYAPIGFHFHWQAPGYLFLFLALGDSVHRRLERGEKLTQWWLRGSVAFTAIALGAITSHAATGWWRAVGPQWLSAKVGEPDDPTLECLDFSTLPGALAERGLLGRPDLFVFSNRWFFSGKVDYALKGQMPVLCFTPDPRSFAFIEPTDRWLGKDAVLVSTKKFLDDPAPHFGPYFARIEPLGTVDVPRGTFVEETLYLYLCHNYHTAYPMPYR